MKAKRPSRVEYSILVAVQEAIEDAMIDGVLTIQEKDDSRPQFARCVLDRLRGQGIRNEELPKLEYHYSMYGRDGVNRGARRKG